MLWNGRGVWKRNAMPLRGRRYAGSFEISSPWNSIEPPSFRSDPEMHLMSVVLPGAIAMLTSESAWKPPKCLDTPCTLRSGAFIALPQNQGQTTFLQLPPPHYPRSPRESLPPLKGGRGEKRGLSLISSVLYEFLEQSNHPVGGEHDDEHEEHADHEHVDLARDGDGDDLLDRAQEQRADHRPQPVNGAADHRHGERRDRVVEAEARSGLDEAQVHRHRRPGRAHQGPGHGAGEELELERRHA